MALRPTLAAVFWLLIVLGSKVETMRAEDVPLIALEECIRLLKSPSEDLDVEMNAAASSAFTVGSSIFLLATSFAMLL